MRAAAWIGILALAGAATVTVAGARTEATALVAGWQEQAESAVRGAGDVRVRMEGRVLHVEGEIGDSEQLAAVRRSLGAIEGLTEIMDGLRLAPLQESPPVPEVPSTSIGQPAPEAEPGPASPCQDELESLFRAESIQFTAFSAALGAGSDALLDDVAEIMAKCPGSVLEISGHADGQGSAELNDSLSRARAEVVRQHLMGRGIDGARVLAVGLGDRAPIADDATESGRMRNRRIEIRLRERP